jgi:hypothetical protein
MTRKPLPLAALALTVLAVPISACGSSAPAQTAVGAGNPTARAQKAVSFAKCMRRNGVSEFPDPGASGRLTIDGVVNGSSLDPGAPAFEHAISACKALEPAGFMGGKRSPQQQSAGLRFAQCIRENGVKDFPDPIPNGPLVDTNRIPSANQPGGMTLLHGAMERCGDAAAAAGVTR